MITIILILIISQRSVGQTLSLNFLTPELIGEDQHQIQYFSYRQTRGYKTFF